MRRFLRLTTPLLLLVLGFALGRFSGDQVSPASAARAQEATAQDATAKKAADDAADTSYEITPADAEKLKKAIDAVAVAERALIQSGHYVKAIRTPNAYAVLHGGLDAMKALESGQGVDPVTFAGLYRGDAIDDVLVHLDRDSFGRLTYKGNLVRLIPVSRMKELQAQREAVLDVAKGSGS